MKKQSLNILFLGDIFGEPGVKTVEKLLPDLIKQNNIDFVIAQGENVTGRKGLDKNDYDRLTQAGVNAFTMGNHVWANDDIKTFIDNSNVIRPYNIDPNYPGEGSKIFTVNDLTIRVTSIMGITFNELLAPWEQSQANNFFDAMDHLIESEAKADFHFVDFHAETTSEKNVFALYLDGKVDAVCGTHTHVQTNDARVLPNGTCFICDAGMTGPMNSAIGANFDEVYHKMRYNARERFKVSDNNTQLNGVIITFDKQNGNNIKPINISNIEV
ncbi:TIGR00282 family metallophosphoesterase [Mycoplasma seminis]|uniref:TIGR00282 family metallophosphoesterase n=1 Tax=Mycoplasma seminis TaxID=512749 RepID=A0ABY9HDF9_9MOLU|nr:TIGR00282 family metallophosphoesterase [Mycoplasma seminis]WLP85713.1 TIGR00282 family metallophosphoesterase [Mycoplasma seminis]